MISFFQELMTTYIHYSYTWGSISVNMLDIVTKYDFQ